MRRNTYKEMMIVADYIFSFLKRKTDVVFLITGGHAMYLDNALRKSGIRYICTHHEQAAGMAAEAYGRITGKIGVALITAGPAVANIINGVMGAYVDSSPVMVIAGQSPLRYVKYMEKTNIRQHGVQGINVKPLVQSIVKQHITLEPPHIKNKFRKIYSLALSGRPGPVWVDVPLDVQNAQCA